MTSSLRAGPKVLLRFSYIIVAVFLCYSSLTGLLSYTALGYCGHSLLSTELKGLKSSEQYFKPPKRDVTFKNSNTTFSWMNYFFTCFSMKREVQHWLSFKPLGLRQQLDCISWFQTLYSNLNKQPLTQRWLVGQ